MSPLPFVVESMAQLSPGSVLDVACGRGRHFPAYLASGASITGIDRDTEVLAQARHHAPTAQLMTWDVEAQGLPPRIQAMTFDVVVTTFFLYRPLIVQLAAVLTPADGDRAGGHWLLETFHSENCRRRSRPRRELFALQPGEASELAKNAGLEVVFCDEGERGDVFTTRLMARKTA